MICAHSRALVRGPSLHTSLGPSACTEWALVVLHDLEAKLSLVRLRCGIDHFETPDRVAAAFQLNVQPAGRSLSAFEAVPTDASSDDITSVAVLLSIFAPAV